MANLKQQTEKTDGSKGVWSFLDRNWQIVAVILAVVAIFVWYQALNLGTNIQQVLDDGTQGTTTTPQNPDTTTPAGGTTSDQPSQSAGRSYTQTAQKGQGVTHLARQALQSYLATAKPQITLSREHKIYIEDYLKDQKVGEIRHLDPGQQVAFSADAIQQGIELSQKLTPAQLQNLTQYANKVSGLQAYSLR